MEGGGNLFTTEPRTSQNYANHRETNLDSYVGKFIRKRTYWSPWSTNRPFLGKPAIEFAVIMISMKERKRE